MLLKLPKGPWPFCLFRYLSDVRLWVRHQVPPLIAGLLLLGIRTPTPNSPSTPNLLSHPYDDINAAASPTRKDGDGRLHHAEDEALLELDVDRDPATDATKGHQEPFAPQSL